MKFRVSSGLKSIIGKDLITDDFVAIFELVKNAFDAYSDRVDIYFDESEICIIDNGKGMTKDDLINKWLFVAYSAKHDNTEDSTLRSDYRSELRSRRNTFAGNKGVGRFSCDRLGEKLNLQTKSIDDKKVNVIDLNWSNFELDDKKEFTEINVEFHQDDQFHLPDYLTKKLSIETGTVLRINTLREAESWDRKKLLNLKSSIAKLIDPFGIKDDFDVYLHVPRELQNDSLEIKKLSSDIDFDSPYTNVVNGQVRNFIFTKLASKTTKIKISVTVDDPDFIKTELIDRGECVYEIKEPNTYLNLKNVNIDINLYFMNTAAKNNFTRTMGVESKNFGSVFLFNNGFRVFPIGEPSNDEFRINLRKAQGYNRYLGTRELLGMIDINGRPEDFKEASSRDKGLINTAAYSELVELFLRKALIRLESYVVNVSWQDKLDSDVSDISRVLSDQGKTRVVEVLAKLISGKNIELLRYSEKLIDTISIRNNSFEENINHLATLADKSGSKALKDKVELALIQYKELKKAELESRLIAENERKIREAAEVIAVKETEKRKEAQRNLELISIAFEDEKKRNLFLKKATSVDIKTIRNFHHQIGIYASNINHIIKLKLDAVNHSSSTTISKEEFIQALDLISFKNKQILTISRIATVADYRMSAEEIEDDLVIFIKEYIENVSAEYATNIDVTVTTDGSQWVTKFLPLEAMVFVDNIVSNSSKPNSGCSKINFNIHSKDKNRLTIEITDDGRGFAEHLKHDIERIFDIGVTTTDGSGLGLYHARQVINEMNGSIEADLNYTDGAKFIIRFAK